MVPTIRRLYQEARSSALLGKYLEGCSRALCVAMSGVNRVDRRAFLLLHLAPFDSVLDLAERHARSAGSSALVTLLLCYIARLGEVVRYVFFVPPR